MSDSKEYRKMLLDLELTNKDIAEITGMSIGHIRNATANSQSVKFPKWLKLAIYIHKKKASD